jgi:hypothetical protein
MALQEMIPRWSLAMLMDDYPGFAPSNPIYSQPSWNFRNVFTGYDADFTVPWSGWPFTTGNNVLGGQYSQTAEVRPGTAAFIHLLGGFTTQPQAIELQAPGGGGAAPAELRIAIVRYQ